MVFWTTAVYLTVSVILVATRQIRTIHLGYGSLMAVISGALAASGLILFFFVVRQANVSRAVPFMASYPVVTIALASLVFSERLTLVQALGVALVLAGLVILSSQSA